MCLATGEIFEETFMATIKMRNATGKCPLVEVPEPHGRLIDADALQCKVDDIGLGYYAVLGVTEDTIEMAPTVIGAEGGEDE